MPFQRRATWATFDPFRRRPDGRCRLMGILNVTPDFHADSRVDLESAVERAMQMWSNGADWVDVGGINPTWS